MPPKSKKAKVADEPVETGYSDKRKRNNDVSIVSQDFIINEMKKISIGRQKISRQD
jgi:hypothetical protein